MDKCAIQKLFNPDTIYLAICTSGLTPFENASLRSKYWHDIILYPIESKIGEWLSEIVFMNQKKNPENNSFA